MRRTTIIATVLAGLAAVALRPAMAWDLTYPDGSKVAFEKVPYFQTLSQLLEAQSKLPPGADFVIAAVPPPCPTSAAWAWVARASGWADSRRQLERCNELAAAKVERLASTVRPRCRCEIFAEGVLGQSVFLRAKPEFAADRMVYAMAKIVERGPRGTSEGRGVLGYHPNGTARLFNQSLDPVCTGTFGLATTDVRFDCGKGEVIGKGFYEAFVDRSVAAGRYGLARLQLASDLTIDIAVNLSDEDLRRLHPNFPAWR